MKKILLSVLTFLTIGAACFAGCMEPTTKSNGGSAEDNQPKVTIQTAEEENDDNTDENEKPVPPPCEHCKPRRRHGGRPKPMPRPEPEPEPQN